MTCFKTSFSFAAVAGALWLAPQSAQAAKTWVVPSTTVLSGANAWITIDAAGSDDLFFPNLRPLALDTVQVLDSEGQLVAPQNPATGKLRATFDVQLTKPGTYKIASVATSVMASWTENGEVKRFRGSGEDFAKQAPAGAADLKTIRTLSRNETFVTRDNPTTTVFKTTGQGLELVPVTHPTDVIMGEPTRFRLLLDGKPAAGLEVSFMRGGDRWKARPTEVKVRTAADGALEFTPPEGGIWWMSATFRSGETGRGPGPGGPGGPGGGPPRGEGAPRPLQPLPGDGYSASYTATFEAQLP